MSIDATIIEGDALDVLSGMPPDSVDCCVTSPPYWGLRDYGVAGQLGLERRPEEYIERLADVFDEVRRVLNEAGTLWVVIGDTYMVGKGPRGDNLDRGYKADGGPPGATPNRLPHPEIPIGNLVGIPWMLAFALQSKGWILRSSIVWDKPNAMPESVKDRPSNSHELVFLFAKSRTYYYDVDATRTPHATGPKTAHGANAMQGRLKIPNPSNWDETQPAESFYHPKGKNLRTVWRHALSGQSGEHIASYPERLIEPMILAGCPEGGVVLDSFVGSGTTVRVANRLGRSGIGIELNSEYAAMAKRRCSQGMLA